MFQASRVYRPPYRPRLFIFLYICVIIKIMARPTTYNFKLAEEICLQLYDNSLTTVLSSNNNYPARSTFFKWKREHKELSDFYVNIAQDKGILFIEEIDQTIQDLRNGDIDPSSANVIIQSLKWKAAKFYPKMFGDKLDVDHTSKGEKINLTPMSFVSNDKD